MYVSMYVNMYVYMYAWDLQGKPKASRSKFHTVQKRKTFRSPYRESNTQSSDCR